MTNTKSAPTEIYGTAKIIGLVIGGVVAGWGVTKFQSANDRAMERATQVEADMLIQLSSDVKSIDTNVESIATVQEAMREQYGLLGQKFDLAIERSQFNSDVNNHLMMLMDQIGVELNGLPERPSGLDELVN